MSVRPSLVLSLPLALAACGGDVIDVVLTAGSGVPRAKLSTIDVRIRIGDEPIRATLDVPSGAFDDGESDFELEVGSRKGSLDVRVWAADSAGRVVASGEALGRPLDTDTVKIRLGAAEEGAWSPPESIGADATGGEMPAAAMDSVGGAMIAWTDGNAVRAVRRGPGGSFEAPSDLGDGLGGGSFEAPSDLGDGLGAASDARIVFDAADGAWATWIQLGETRDVLGSRWAPGDGWGEPPPFAIDSNDVNAVLEHALAAGGPLVVAAFSQPAERVTASLFEGGAWHPPAAEFDAPGAPARSVRVSASAEGFGAVVWARDGRIEATRTDPETGFAPVEIVSDGADGLPRDPRVAVATGGDLVVTYVVEMPDTTDELRARRFAAGTWTAEEVVDSGPGRIFELEAPGAPSGETVVVFSRGDSVQGAIWDGIAWATSTIEDAGATGELAAAMNDARKAVAVFVVAGDRGDQVFGSTRAPGSGWSEPVALSIGALASSPAVALSPTGDAAAAWVEAGEGIQAAAQVAPEAE